MAIISNKMLSQTLLATCPYLTFQVNDSSAQFILRVTATDSLQGDVGMLHCPPARTVKSALKCFRGWTSGYQIRDRFLRGNHVDTAFWGHE